MTDEMIALSRRAVACRYWEWMEGMAVVFPDGLSNRVTHVEIGDVGYGLEWYPNRMADRMIGDASCIQWREYEMLPDLTDPATMGCLLALVREAWGKPAVPMYWGDYWQVVHTLEVEDGCAGHKHIGDGDTEAEALVAALEDAP